MKRYLEKTRLDIDNALDNYLPGAKVEPKALHKAMRYSVFSGGKRIRPILAIEASAVCGKRSPQILAAACAIELIHTYSLIHDDLPSMDDDDYRRGKPSCHKAFGEAEAILAGDALLTLAFNLIAKKYEPETGINLIKELSEAIGTEGMVGGQALDIEFDGKNKDKIIAAKINRLKTAKLFEVSAKIGAISSGAKAEKIKKLANFGLYLGCAFQVTDDILDGESLFTKKDAEIFINKAKLSLEIFGDKALRLKKMADLVLHRLV